MRNKSILSVLIFVAAIVWLGGFSTPMALGVTDNVVYQGSFPASTTSGMTHAVLTINGTPRDLLIYRPSTAQSLPLLIYFDGTGADIATILGPTHDNSWLRYFADSNNLIIAYPAQRVMSYGDWDNHFAGDPYFETAVAPVGSLISSAVSSDPNVNPDLLFTRAIIKEASVAYGADLTRVYTLGFSNGAFFSYFVAATLNDKIAAFAESAGGLVLSNTTIGTPTLCAPAALPGTTGAVRSCADAGWSAGICSASGAIPRPIAPASVVSVPPGFMEANDDDTTVPWAHTCNLANALPVSSNYVVRIFHNGGGHSGSAGYFDNAWNFMKKFSTTTSACTYTLSPTSQSFTSSGGIGSVSVTASSSSCAWTASSSLSWATITSGSGTGSGTATFTVSANTLGAGQRTGNITIAGQTFVITQLDTAFADVLSTNVFYNYINAIYNAAITRGCSQNPLMYCPDADVTRGQMAAFIIRAKYGENFTYTQTPYFSDVPATNAFFKYVQRLKDDAITTVTGTYGVNDAVTRGQMAAFIIRAKYGENFTYTQTPYFSDVPATNAFFKYVQKLKDTGITVVTGTYGVNDVVARGQMAAFIARAFLGMP